jgi:hypothetical protein
MFQGKGMPAEEKDVQFLLSMATIFKSGMSDHAGIIDQETRRQWMR